MTCGFQIDEEMVPWGFRFSHGRPPDIRINSHSISLQGRTTASLNSSITPTHLHILLCKPFNLLPSTTARLNVLTVPFVMDTLKVRVDNCYQVVIPLLNEALIDCPFNPVCYFFLLFSRAIYLLARIEPETLSFLSFLLCFNINFVNHRPSS